MSMEWEWTRPTSSGGSSSRARHADPTDAPGSGRASGTATGGPAFLVLPIIISIITRGHRRIIGPGPDLSIMTDGRVWTA